jgi:hypothetical protein
MGLDFRVRRGRNRKSIPAAGTGMGAIRASAAQLITYWSFRHHVKKHNLSGEVVSDVEKFRSESGHRTKRGNSL